MKHLGFLTVTTVLVALSVAPVHGQVRITEVAPWSSGIAAVGGDWFEVTNFGASPISLVGWKMDDNSFSFGSSVALSGVTSLAAGASAIFIEGNSTQSANFVTNWFGGTAPVGFQIGTYSGSGIGLSTAGDGVILFDAAGSQQAKVSFGASGTTSPFASFDNSAGLDNATLSTLSVSGISGAFQVTHGPIVEIGSPGAVTAVPEPQAYAILLAGLALTAAARRRRTGHA